MRTIPGYDNFKVDDANRRVYINGTWYDFGDIIKATMKRNFIKSSFDSKKGGIGNPSSLVSFHFLTNAIVAPSAHYTFSVQISTKCSQGIIVMDFGTDKNSAKDVLSELESIIK